MLLVDGINYSILVSFEGRARNEQQSKQDNKRYKIDLRDSVTRTKDGIELFVATCCHRSTV